MATTVYGCDYSEDGSSIRLVGDLDSTEFYEKPEYTDDDSGNLMGEY